MNKYTNMSIRIKGCKQNNIYLLDQKDKLINLIFYT